MGDKCGKTGGYNEHMKDGTPPCQPCKTARADAARDWRKRRYLTKGRILVDATGSRRRLQALAAMGYALRTLGKELDWNPVNVYEFARGNQSKVYAATADKVAALYDRLSMIPPENTRAAKVVRTHARKKGFVPPLAWDEETIDDPEAIPQGMTKTLTWEWIKHQGTPEQRKKFVEESGWVSRKSQSA